MAFQPFSMQRWTRGTILLGEPDAIPEDALRRAVNVRLDRTAGSIEVRPGWLRKTAAPFLAPLTMLSRLYTALGEWTYAVVGTAIHILESSFVESQAPFEVGSGELSAVNSPDGAGNIWKVWVNQTMAVKHQGTGAWVQLGIPAPTAAPLSATLATDLSTLIDDFHTAANWTGVNTTGVSNVSDVYQVSPPALLVGIAANTLGSIVLWHPGTLAALPLGTLSLANDDYIALWVYLDNPTNVAYIQIDIDCSGTGSAPGTDKFTTEFFTIRILVIQRVKNKRGVGFSSITSRTISWLIPKSIGMNNIRFLTFN